MATAYAPAAPSKATGLTKRQRLDRMFAAVWAEMSPIRSQAAQIGDVMLPSRPRWCLSNTQPTPNWGRVLAPTATIALRTLAAGMVSGLSSPARPWFLLTTTNRDLDAIAPVKRWLTDVRDAILLAMERSNFYTEAETVYADCAMFGTAALSIEEDPETVVRCESHPIGSYAIAQDSRRRVNTFAREWMATASQMEEAWGREVLSEPVKAALRAGNEQTRFAVRHMIYPNPEWRPEAAEVDATRKRFAECYWEPSTPVDGDVFLREGGYDEFPLAVPRWGPLAPGDVWGSMAPGQIALGSVLALFEMRRQTWNALRKQVTPPTVSGPAWRNKTIYSIPGANNVEDVVQGDPTLRSMYQVAVPYDQIEATMEQVRQEIRTIFYADIMAPVLMDDRADRPTAAEVYQTRDEQYGMLGPVVERMSDDFHDPAIDRIFGILVRRAQADWAAGIDSDVLPMPPKELEGRPLRVQLISTMAQAQKSLGVTALERHMLFVGQMAGMYGQPALDNAEADEIIREHAAATGVPPKGTRSADEVAAIRERRAAAQAAANAAASMPGVAKAARDLSETKLNTDSALDALARAGTGA